MGGRRECREGVGDDGGGRGGVGGGCEAAGTRRGSQKTTEGIAPGLRTAGPAGEPGRERAGGEGAWTSPEWAGGGGCAQLRPSRLRIERWSTDGAWLPPNARAVGRGARSQWGAHPPRQGMRFEVLAHRCGRGTPARAVTREEPPKDAREVRGDQSRGGCFAWSQPPLSCTAQPAQPIRRLDD